VGGHQQRPLGRAAAAHWAEQSGARLVNGAIAELVQDAPRGSGVFCEFGFEPARPLGRGQGVEASHGTGTAHRVPLAAGGIAPGGRQMRWPQAAPPQKDEVGFGLDTCQAAGIVDLEAVNAGGPVPAALLSGFEDGKARSRNPALGRAIAPHSHLAFQERGEGVDVGPRVVGRVWGEIGRLRRKTGEVQIGEVALKGVECLCWPLSVMGRSHGGLPPRGRVMTAVGWRSQC